MNGLDTFDGYLVTLSPPPPPSSTPSPHPITVPKSLNTLTIDGLEHFTAYTVTVVTYNEGGQGPATAFDTVTTLESGVCV